MKKRKRGRELQDKAEDAVMCSLRRIAVSISDDCYNIVNAVEKEYKLLFNRRTFGPPAHKVRVRFL